jgi:hypothetical protein
MVVLELDLRESGSIADMRVIRDVPFTTNMAKKAVAQWDFAPEVKDGKPMRSTVIVAISFVAPAPHR